MYHLLSGSGVFPDAGSSAMVELKSGNAPP